MPFAGFLHHLFQRVLPSKAKSRRKKNIEKAKLSAFYKLSRFYRTLRHMPLAQLVQKLDYCCRTLYYRSPLYAFVEYDVAPPKELLYTAPDLWPGSIDVGHDIMKNFFTFQGRKIHTGKNIHWAPQGASEAWLFDFHSFNWLADLRATHDPQARTLARDHIKDWVMACGSFHPTYWHPFALSRRLTHWLTHSSWLLDGADNVWRKMFMVSLTRQANHLPKVLEWHASGYRFIKNLKAQIFTSLCLPSRQSAYLEAADLLKKQLEKQILVDGMHYERSPYYHAMVLKDLLDIHAMIIKAGQIPGEYLDEAVDSMSVALAFMRHNDGALSLFNSSTVGDVDLLDAIQERCGLAETIPAELPYAGFSRLEAGPMCLLVDVGIPAKAENTTLSHAGTLSFELSLAEERVFVNSGSRGPWHPEANTFRATEAHNTITLNHESSAEVWGKGKLGRRPEKVSFSMGQEPGLGIGLEANHDGYRHLGVKHIRRLFVNTEGTDLRGEDILESKKTKQTLAVQAHFHLHPDVRYKLISHQEAEITLKSGKILVLLVKGGQLFDSPSVYCPDGGTPQKTNKLVLRGTWQKGKCMLNWAVRERNKK